MNGSSCDGCGHKREDANYRATNMEIRKFAMQSKMELGSTTVGDSMKSMRGSWLKNRYKK